MRRARDSRRVESTARTRPLARRRVPCDGGNVPHEECVCVCVWTSVRVPGVAQASGGLSQSTTQVQPHSSKLVRRRPRAPLPTRSCRPFATLGQRPLQLTDSLCRRVSFCDVPHSNRLRTRHASYGVARFGSSTRGGVWDDAAIEERRRHQEVTRDVNGAKLALRHVAFLESIDAHKYEIDGCL